MTLVLRANCVHCDRHVQQEERLATGEGAKDPTRMVWVHTHDKLVYCYPPSMWPLYPKWRRKKAAPKPKVTL